MRSLTLSAAAALLSLALSVPASAVRLEPGDLVVYGRPYFGSPTPGACHEQICTVDPVSGAVTPISAPGALASYGNATDVLVSRWNEVLIATEGGLLRMDPATGAVTTLSSFGGGRLASTPSGRLFVQSGSAVFEIDRATGTATPFALASGLLASSSTLEALTFAPDARLAAGSRFYRPLLRLDLATGTSAELDRFYEFDGSPQTILRDLAVNEHGDTLVIADWPSPTLDSAFYTAGVGPLPIIDGNTDPFGFSVCGAAGGLGRSGVLFCSTSEGFIDRELRLYAGDGGPPRLVDLDFFPGPGTVVLVPEPSTALLFALGLLGLACARRP